MSPNKSDYHGLIDMPAKSPASVGSSTATRQESFAACFGKQPISQFALLGTAGTLMPAQASERKHHGWRLRGLETTKTIAQICNAVMLLYITIGVDKKNMTSVSEPIQRQARTIANIKCNDSDPSHKNNTMTHHQLTRAND